jgi:dihydrofolate synthase/folylpolyglutamate synthase
MLDDKDITEVIEIMTPHIDSWFVSTLNDPRGLPVMDLVREMRAVDKAHKTQEIEINEFDSLEMAWNACKSQLTEADKVIVFGSFLVLSQFKVIF